MTIRRCLASAPPKTLEAGPGAACGAEPFRAWVRGDRIRRVAFRLDGRRLGAVTVAMRVVPTKSSTRVTPCASLAAAWRETIPATVAPGAGEVSATVGAV